MQVSNNYINNAHVQRTTNASGVKPFIPSTPFKQALYTSAPKKTSAPSGYINVTDFYSPKLLLSTYAKKDFIEKFIKNNPNIENILASKGVQLEISPENVLDIRTTHLQTTDIIAKQLATEMGLSQADKKILEQAAIFHDFGKTLIPKDILNKPGKLTKEEKEIVDLHAELGYELLSSAGFNKRTLNIIKYHHQPQKSGDILCQILSVADIYSALRENRSYKQALSNSEAIAILDQKAQNGEVSSEVVDALKSITTKAA